MDLSPEAIQKLADYFELLQEIANEVGLDDEDNAILEESNECGGSEGT